MIPRQTEIPDYYSLDQKVYLNGIYELTLSQKKLLEKFMDGREIILDEGNAVETAICHWLEKNSEKIGLKIIKKLNTGADYLMEDKKGIIYTVEVEPYSSRFLEHRHDLYETDILICYNKNRDIPELKIIELSKHLIFFDEFLKLLFQCKQIT